MKHGNIHPDLKDAQELAYKHIRLTYNTFVPEPESAEYGACSFELANKKINYRVAKITPTKIGQFVTFWKRIGNSPIVPYDIHDPFDLLIVSVRSEKHFGQFIFPKDALTEQGLLSTNLKGGKRAVRVYPPWDITRNKQAAETQDWQCPYFLEIQPNFDTVKMQKLLHLI